MYCESCGNFIPDGQAFCSNCGARLAAPQAPQAAPAASAAPAAPAPQTAAVSVAPVAPAAVQPIQAAPAQPVYQQPVYQQPVYQQPAQPVYQQTIQPVYQQPVYQQPVAAVNPIPAKRGNGAAVAGMIFGILTALTSWIPFFFYLFGLIGLICSIVGIAKRNARGKGMAIAGLILSILFSVGGGLLTQFFWVDVVGSEAKELINELETYDGYSTYSTSIKNNKEFFIDGDFVTTENGYVSGVLHIDGVRVDF